MRALLALLTGSDEVEGQREGCSDGQPVVKRVEKSGEMLMKDSISVTCGYSVFISWTSQRLKVLTRLRSVA